MRKGSWIKAILLIALAAAAFVAIFLAWAVYMLSGEPSKDIVAKIASPDGRLIARVVEVNGGATTSFAYDVIIVDATTAKTDLTVASLYGATRSECAYGVGVRWLSKDRLAISYLQAKSVTAVGRVAFGGQAVQIVLQPGIIDPMAPCGGMASARDG